MKRTFFAGLLLFSTPISGFLNPASAIDPKPEVQKLTVCTQNLKNYGPLSFIKTREKGATPASLAQKEQSLVKRFAGARCDIIAVQEITGKLTSQAQATIKQLAEALKIGSGREFETVLAGGGDGFIRVGMLFAKDRVKFLQAVTYENVELPKLIDEQKPRFFERPALEVQVEAKLGGRIKIISLVNFHFKSRANAKGDTSGLQWETYRMEAAEALRRIVEIRHEINFQRGDSILMVLGDRNANYDLATAKILEGNATLNDFKVGGPCRLSKRGVPICATPSRGPQKLFSVITQDPETKLLAGTYVYKNEYSWIDDILMPTPSLPYARQTPSSEGNYDSFIVRTFGEASDHALVGVRLQW